MFILTGYIHIKPGITISRYLHFTTIHYHLKTIIWNYCPALRSLIQTSRRTSVLGQCLLTNWRGANLLYTTSVCFIVSVAVPTLTCSTASPALMGSSMGTPWESSPSAVNRGISCNTLVDTHIDNTHRHTHKHRPYTRYYYTSVITPRGVSGEM